MNYNAHTIEAQRRAKMTVDQGIGLGKSEKSNHSSISLLDLFAWVPRPAIFKLFANQHQAPNVIHDEVDVTPEAE